MDEVWGLFGQLDDEEGASERLRNRMDTIDEGMSEEPLENSERYFWWPTPHILEHDEEQRIENRFGRATQR